MAFTRRGWGAVVIVVAGFAFGITSGARSLSAIVTPLLVAILASRYQIRTVERPFVSRTLPEDGFVSEERTVELEFDVPAPQAGHVTDNVGSGLSAIGNDVDYTIGHEPLSYRIRLDARGVQELGPAEVTVTDVLGLNARSFEYTDTDDVLVYPRVYELTGTTSHELNLLADEAFRQHNREEFDSLREYERGDSLRDVHWKSSAKRPQDDLVVKQFVAEENLGSVGIVAEAGEDGADAMAEAAASVALYMLDAGVEVGVSCPKGEVGADNGAEHRLELLELLAKTGPGGANALEEDTSIHVHGHGDTATVTVRGQQFPFADLVGTEMTAERRQRAVPTAPGARTDTDDVREVPA
jgi:uncharacterized protein (DUF58 family)